MRRGMMIGLLLAVCLLSGCAALLERSYGVVEPYADRYWDSSAEDTLRVESYQDLVNSLLLLIEERAETCVIRCYGEADDYQEAMTAREEIRRETMLGAYLLRDLRLSYESGTGYSTITCTMLYREDAEDMASIMPLSDSQSLVDLLRVTVREERDKLTARFTYDTPREDVIAAVESFWQELCQAETEAEAAQAAADAALVLMEEEPGVPGEPGEDAAPEDGESVGEPQDAGDPSREEDVETGEETAGEGDAPENPDPPEQEEPVIYPPCPWKIKFYPDQKMAEIVEVLLRS